MKVKEVMRRVFTASAPDFHSDKTCDILHIGDPEAEVKAIATCFMADMGVIKKASELGVNLIITHEPTFYSSMDDRAWISGNPVSEAKKKYLEDNKISIWRFHDHMHFAKPDLIYEGWRRLFGWENYLVPGNNEHHYRIPEMTLKSLCSLFKTKLGMNSFRVIGRDDMICKDIGVLVGGGSLGLGDELMPARSMMADNYDVLVCGEIIEWTVCSFVRDAVLLGHNKAMIILGHNRTEECGMQYLPQWLAPLVEGIPVCHISSGDPVRYIT
jgi:putative NIF3 family GTP cyclohydrolase 1 type 2